MSAARYTLELESIARNARVFSGQMDEVFTELGQRLTACMEVERVNLWMFHENDRDEYIECVGNYSQKEKAFSKGEKLFKRDIPDYFAHLKSNRILVIDNVHESKVTEQIRDVYCDKYGITSMLDLPIRMQGELRGVMCYEHTGRSRVWSEEEVQFALAANQIVALAMETMRRRKVQKEMAHVLREKELLLKEMHHRIKNNLSVLTSLLRMQGRESNDPHVQSVLSDCETRIFSMAKIHEQLYQSEDYLSVELHKYIHQLVEEFRTSSLTDTERVAFHCDLAPVTIETSRAINLGLIVMEILNNALKHAFIKGGDTENHVQIELKKSNEELVLRISDNGHGFSQDDRKKNSLGLSLIEDLSEQIDAQLELNTSEQGSSYTLRFLK